MICEINLLAEIKLIRQIVKSMNVAPETIDSYRVICYSPIDSRHRFTGNTKQVVHGKLMGAMAGLAICKLPNSEDCYLFGCDPEWNAVTDTWHRNVDEAKEQAEFEYSGISNTWIFPAY